MPIPETLSTSEPSLLAICFKLVPLFLVFGFPIILGLAGIRKKMQHARLLQETILKLAESNHPIPQELLLGILGESSDRGGRKTLRNGIMCVAAGLGTSLMFISMDRPWGFGLVPSMIGLGFLLVWKLESRKEQ